MLIWKKKSYSLYSLLFIEWAASNEVPSLTVSVLIVKDCEVDNGSPAGLVGLEKRAVAQRCNEYESRITFRSFN